MPAAKQREMKKTIDQVDRSSAIIQGIDMNDYPDFCDAYIDYAEWDDGEELTDDELDRINQTELPQELALEKY